MHGIGVLTPSTASKRRLCSPRTRGEANRIPFSRRSRARAMPRHSRNRHCEEPTGPARSGRPDDRLRDEAIQRGSARYFVVQRNGTAELDCFAALAMTKEKRKQNADRRVILPSASCDAARALCLFSSPEIRGGLGRARSPVGVPPRRLLQRTNATAQLQIRASWDLVGAHDPKCSNNLVRKTARFSTHDPEKWLPVFRQDHAST